MRSLLLPSLIALSAPAMAQDAAPVDEVVEDREAVVGTDGREILVVATRLMGQLDVPQAPVATLDEADIAAFGANSLADLLGALGPQTGSGRGRGSGHPVILLNGQRIGNFRELRNFSPEAVRRVEILPEEVALRFGFPANARVVNFILKESYAGKTIEGETDFSDRGGTADYEAGATLLKIAGANRFNLSAEFKDTTPLSEAERGVIQQPGSLSAFGDPAEWRSLVADSRQIALNGSWTRGLGEKGMEGQITANLAYTRNDSLSFSGLDLTGDPLARDVASDKFEGSLGFARPLGSWQFNLTGDGALTKTRTEIDRTASGFDTARSKSDSMATLATLAGRPLRLPAGEVSATFKAGFAHTGITSSDTRSGLGETRLKRGDLSGGINLALPLASRRENVAAALGEVTLNLSAGVGRLSDFGTLTDWSAGLTWQLTEKLGFQATWLVNEAAPSLTDLGNPAVSNLNVSVYDFTRAETALVTITSGGNPALRRETQKDLKLGVNWALPFMPNATIMAEYFRNRSTDVTASFPLLTPAIEAAFPGRVKRENGVLVAIDRRPVTFARTEGERLRWGVQLSGTVGKAPAGRAGGMGAPGAGGPPRMGGGPMMGMMGGPGGQGRWSLSLFHTLRFADEVLVAPGGPVLDLLGGDALSGGGSPRNALEFEGGAFHKGKGLRLNGSWTAPTRVRASGLPGTSDLRFGSVFKLDLRAFVDMGQVSKAPILKGLRVALTAENLFDSRQKVTDGSGAVPLSYQPDTLDSRGRVLGIDLRKAF